MIYLVASWRNWLVATGLLLSGLIVAAAYLAPTLTGQIKLQSVGHDGGFAYVAEVTSTHRWFYRLKTDGTSTPMASKLWLFENGRSVGPAHSLHVDVRQAGAGRYSHWGTQIWFSASDGTDPRENGRSYEYQSKLSIKPWWVAIGVISLAAALALSIAAMQDKIKRLRALAAFTFVTMKGLWRRYGISLLRTPILTMRAVASLLLLGSSAFLIAAFYALLTGWALPSAAPIRWFSLAGLLVEREPIFHFMLVSLTMVGMAASWFSSLLLRSTSALRRDEILLGRFLRRWGIYLAVVLFVFSVSAMWAGHLRASDPNWASIAGLIPFSDANGYFAGVHDQAKDGAWNAISLRRPLAAAFRSSLMFVVGFSYANAVLLQAILVACAGYAAARAVGDWRGIYAGIVFFALSYAAVRTFLPTFLTESLGLFWALLAIPFFVSALRDRSLQSALIGLSMTTIALFMRPGSVFTIPALCLWLVWTLGREPLHKLRVGTYAAGIVLSVVVAGSLLQRTYGIGSDLTGSNFSYVLCGLSIGTDWNGCPNRYEEVMTLSSEKTVTDFLYKKALENIATQPAVMLERLYDGALAFIVELPAILWRGYSWSGSDYSLLKLSFFGLAVLGLVYVALYRRESGELLFWLVVWGSVVASAGFVYFDEGRRVLSAIYPLLLMFFASGFLTRSVPIRRTPAPHSLTSRGWVGLLCTAMLFFALPALAHMMSPARDPARSPATPLTPSNHIVFGGRRVTGMLVVPDDAPLRTDIPTISISRFSEFVRLSNVEFYQGLLNPTAPDVPFGFIATSRIENGVASNYQYIVPPFVMQRSDVMAWSFHVREWNRKQPYGPYWYFVEKAEALW